MSENKKEYPIKGYKGFNRDMKCRDFQYEEGGEYETDGVSICSRGFHFCEHPLDVLGYYSPANSVYHEVEGGGDTDREKDGDSKVACSRIKVGARLDIAGLVKAHIEYVKSHCTNENNAEDGKPATAGDYGAATAGDCGAATAGDYGAATAGDYGAATAGYRGAATSRGSSSSGDNGLSVARGNGCRVKGGLGAILVIAEENKENYSVEHWKAVVVDGENIKADTWYELEGGELVECKE